MRRRLLSLVLAFLAACGTVVATARPAQAAEFGRIWADGVRLRTGPSATATVIGLLYDGDALWLLSSASSGWCRIRLYARSASGLPAGTVGYVSCYYIALIDQGSRLSRTGPVDALAS